jgi:anaerobic selenocysteine-containing dehydrogenase
MELHPETAEVRGIAAGDWVAIETPKGSVRARARLNPSLDARVVCGQHGWWQACKELGAPAYNPFEPDGANLNYRWRCSRPDQRHSAPPSLSV